MALKPKRKSSSTSFSKDLIATSKACDLAYEDVNNDLKREDIFLKQALSSVVKARKRILKSGIPFSKPPGYFCEMLKTQEQMTKINKAVEEQKKNTKEAEEAKKQRQLKKFGKKVQTEKLLERQKQKSEGLAKIDKLRKSKSIWS